MTSKIQIDDEMIRRFRDAAGPYLGLPKPPCGALLSEEAIREWKKEVARGILEKTLAQAAPEEPEIPVSEAMAEAGRCVMLALGVASSHARMADVYRAMEKERRKEMTGHPFHFLDHIHIREHEKGPGAVMYRHRRKDDSK